MRWVGLVTALCIGFLGAPACGGGGDGPGGSDPQVTTLRATPALDGYVTSGLGNWATAGNGIDVGDQDGLIDGTFRNGFLSFDLSTIPAGASVQQATLRCYQTEIAGSPYLTIGEIVVDHLDYGATLDAADYGLASLDADIGSFFSSSSLDWRTLPVTEAVRAALTMGLPRCQFRLRFSLEPPGNATSDLATFEDGEGSQGTGNRPELVITWSQP
jgi:hypothetical protein